MLKKLIASHVCLLLLCFTTSGCKTVSIPVPVWDTDGYKDLFNGKSLAGWEDEFGRWSVEDGCLVAGDLKTTFPHDSFLYSKKSYSDFELHVEVKLLGGITKNTGIWYRCRPYFPEPDEGDEEDAEEEMDEEEDIEDDGEEDGDNYPEVALITGYECDLFMEDDPAEPQNNYWGTLHDSYRRPLRIIGDQTKIDDYTNLNGWNHFVIRAEGNRVQHWMNGFQTVDYVDNDPTAPLEGKIALQVHEGGPQKIFYRNIKIKELK